MLTVMPSERQQSPNLTVAEIRVSHPNGFFRAKRARAISSLLCAQTVEQASVDAQIGKRTLERWLSQPDFQREYESAQKKLLDSAFNILRSSAQCFAETLCELARDKAVAPVIRLAACARGLEILMKIHGYTDLERQLTELEGVVSRMELEGR